MPPSTPDSVVERFRRFAGDERYREFLRTLNTTAASKRRLLAWQSAEWARFRVENPDAPSDFDAVAVVLRICPVHLTRMALESVPIEYGYWVFSEAVIKARDEMFPFANYVSHGPDWRDPDSPSTCLLPVCDACRKALDAWNAKRKHPHGRQSGEA